MSIEEFHQLDSERRIRYALRYDAVACREMPLRWFFIVYKVDAFYIELRFDNYHKDKRAIDARAISRKEFQDYVEKDFYYVLRNINGNP